MRRPATPNRPRTAKIASFPAPIGGWVSNQNLAQPGAMINGARPPQGAAVLENFFPNATSAVLRRGSALYATLGDGSKSVTALFSYVAGSQEQLFGATASAIYNITLITSPDNYYLATELVEALETDTGDTFGDNSTIGLEVFEGTTGGQWSVVQFATAGGIFLVGVNGEDFGFTYDGTSFYPTLEGGIWSLGYDGGTGAFTENDTVTGGTSGATATIVKVVGDDTSGALYLTDIVGTFADDEAITDTDTGAAVANGVPTVLAGALTFDGDPGLTSADLSFVWSYKTRLFFVQKESLDAWYLPVDSIAGELVKLPLGGVFPRGGSLLFGATWSLDSGSSGGLSEQCIFVTTEGEVAVFQGANPSDASDWSKVGVYRIGKPLGPKAFIRAGGDLVIATTIGFVPLSQAIQRDYAALSPSAVSYPIEVAWNEAVANRGVGWNCEVWPEAQMVVVAPPTTSDDDPVMFVANARTGAWAPFTNWLGTCMEVFKGRLFFGSISGKVVEANVGGLDQGQTYTGRYIPLFEDLRTPASIKVAQTVGATLRSSTDLNESVSCQFDYDTTLPSPPSAPPVPVGSQWDNAIWGVSTWGGRMDAVLTQRRHSVSGIGYRLATGLQVTSGSVVPLDAEIIATDVTYTVGDVAT